MEYSKKQSQKQGCKFSDFSLISDVFILTSLKLISAEMYSCRKVMSGNITWSVGSMDIPRAKI